MKIVRAECMVIEIPFDDGSRNAGITPTRWNTLEIPLVRLEDEQGNVGWGDGFGYFTADAVKAITERLIIPSLLDTEIEDIAQWNQQTQRRLHIFGRYGVTLFAISGVDIALWDLKARREEMPLHRLLAGTHRKTVPVYASLVRYADTQRGPEMLRRALVDGFSQIKLHEAELDDIRAYRQAAGESVSIAVDVNCGWSVGRVDQWRPALNEMGIAWLEEPIFPPEDFDQLALLRDSSLPLACGENWCTAVQFEAAMRAGAVDRVQPSVTKVGGISEYLTIIHAAAHQEVDVLPHTPYFGPGFFATLHLAAAFPEVMQLEYHYVQPAAWLLDIEGHRDGDQLRVPDGLGLGVSPDPAVIECFRRA